MEPTKHELQMQELADAWYQLVDELKSPFEFLVEFLVELIDKIFQYFGVRASDRTNPHP